MRQGGRLIWGPASWRPVWRRSSAYPWWWSTSRAQTARSLPRPGAGQAGRLYLREHQFPVSITGYLDPARKATYNRKSFELLALHVIDPNSLPSGQQSLQDREGRRRGRQGESQDGHDIDAGMQNDEQIGILQLQKMTGAAVRAGQFHPGTAPSVVALLGGKIEVHCGQRGGPARRSQERGCPGPGGHG